MHIHPYSAKDKAAIEKINRLCHGTVKMDWKSIIRGNAQGFYSLRGNEVLRFCVHPEMRNQGIGKAMHLDMLRLAKQHDFKKLCMLIREDSPYLKWFVHQFGWRGIGVVRGSQVDLYKLEREIVQ